MSSLASDGGSVNGGGVDGGGVDGRGVDGRGVNGARRGRPGTGLAKTFDNGIQVLECLARHPEGRTVTEVAREVRLDRTVVHRLLTTARGRHLARVEDGGRYVLGFGLLELGATVSAGLREAAGPHLARLAEELGATAFLTVADGPDAVSVAVRVPRSAALHVAYRTGFRHRLGVGAPGLAILAGRPAAPGERAEVTRARRDGYVVTRGELQPGAWGIAAPVPTERVPASVGVVALAALDPPAILPTLQRVARDLAAVVC